MIKAPRKTFLKNLRLIYQGFYGYSRYPNIRHRAEDRGQLIIAHGTPRQKPRSYFCAFAVAAFGADEARVNPFVEQVSRHCSSVPDFFNHSISI